jgi:hypothetical protein
MRARQLPTEPSSAASTDIVGQPYRLPRDPATDQSNMLSLATLGLEGNPSPPVSLGRQVTNPARFFTRKGRPARWRGQRPKVGDRVLDAMVPPQISPGTVRRNIRMPANGIQVQGFFSWAANVADFGPSPAPGTVQNEQTDEYLVTSMALQLPDPLPTVVSETVKPAPGLEPFRPQPGIMGQQGTGWPVLQPAVPSFGSRVPLLRPRGLVAQGGS